DLAVGFARIAQHDAEDVRPAPGTVALPEESAFAEVDLHLLAGAALQPPEGESRLGLELADEAADAVVTDGRAQLSRPTLADPMGGQSEVDLALDGLPEGLAITEPADTRAGIDSGLATRFGAVRRAGGRNGWF